MADTMSGAFSKVVFGTYTLNQGTSIVTGSNAFNASNSNSVYTDSGKVYPLSLALNFIIKA